MNINMDDFVFISDSTSSKVQSYMLDSMVSVIQYGENIPAEILDVLLGYITPAQKVDYNAFSRPTHICMYVSVHVCVCAVCICMCCAWVKNDSSIFLAPKVVLHVCTCIASVVFPVL